MDLLAERSEETATSRNALAERLLHEGLRMDRHALIHFRAGASGLRRPALAGTRLDVGQVIETLRAENGDVAATAEYLSTPEHLIRAALDYYADFADEVDADRAWDAAFAERERERFERTQRVLG
jgi:uncharacterized protein (DUF433 family)